ncbi:MAG: hypothetical protein KBG28_13980 [Kofleriaceae bacterium]|nr:hypothetical protein [Kofleriaceae bacterium]
MTTLTLTAVTAWLDQLLDDTQPPPAPLPLPPWHGWLLLALGAYQARCQWRAEAFARIGPDDDDDGDDDDDDDDDLRTGDVPGAPGWRYEIDVEDGYALTGPDGEVLSTDWGVDAGAFKSWTPARWVDSVRPTRPTLARLWRWRPGPALIEDGFEVLSEVGLVIRTGPDAWRPWTLAPALVTRAGRLEAAMRAADVEPARLRRWRAALGDTDDADLAAAHHAWLQERARTAPRRGNLLDEVLAVTPAEVGLELLRALLSGPVDYGTGHAVELLRDARWPDCAEVVALLRRLGPEDPPFAGAQCLAYLFERGLEPPLARQRLLELAAVQQAPGFGGNPFHSDHALLALVHAPELAPALVEQALRSSVPLCVLEMAAALVIIDEPWATHALTRALADPRQASHAYLAAALRRDGTDLGRRRADADTNRMPARAPDAVGYSFDEVAAAGADGFLERTIDELRPRLARRPR